MPILKNDARICIVGAGAAGISAAWYLRKQGHDRVTILEKTGRPGGKCFSLIDQGRPLEVGACMVAPDHSHVLELAAAVGATMRPIDDFIAVQNSGNGLAYKTLAEQTFAKHGLAEVLLAAWNYLAAQRRHSRVTRRPGFAGMSANSGNGELSTPFAEWAANEGMAPLLTQLLMPCHAFGYGDPSQLPAAYVLRYITSRIYIGMTLSPLFDRIGMRWPRKFDLGFGNLLERAAQGFDIRLNAAIETIQRNNGVNVCWSQTENGQSMRHEESFDLLIVACPPQNTRNFLDWSEEEENLFKLIRTEPYSVTICETEGIPASVTFRDPQPEAGRLIQLWKPHPGKGGCIFYTYRPSPEGLPVERILENIREDLRHFYPDAVLGSLMKHMDWEYFPHVDAEAFAGGFYDDFEAMQGHRATWYCGSLLAFESVESTMAYSEDIVNRLISGA